MPNKDRRNMTVSRHQFPFRRYGVSLVALAVTAATVLICAGGAAADSASAGATAYQNASIAAALANNPTGVRIAPAVVEWNNGSVIMTVPTSAGANAATQPAAATAGL